MQPGHAEIVGAGFGGLVAAIALRRRGWTVRVHERRDTLRGEGYGIAIHNNMARIFATFGILDRVLAGGMKIDRRDSVDAGGRVVMTRKTVRSPYRIDRQHIVALLAERAQEAGAEIRFNSPVKSADPAGAIALESGQSFAADLVVAADGINSTIRDAHGLLDRRIWGRDCGVRITIPRRPEEIAADDRDGTVMIEAWADKRRVLYCPVTKGEYYVLLTCTTRDTAAATSPIDPAVWARSFPTMRDLFVRMRDEADWPQSHWAHFQTIRLKRWSAGRIAVRRRRRARDAALPGAGRRPRDDERTRPRRGVAGRADDRNRHDRLGAARTAADGAHPALDPHLWRDHVPAEADEEDLDPGREAAVGRSSSTFVRPITCRPAAKRLPPRCDQSACLI